MAEVEIEEIVDHLRREMTRALEEAVQKVLPGIEFDRKALFKAFKLAVRKKCRTWEEVPEKLVRI